MTIVDGIISDTSWELKESRISIFRKELPASIVCLIEDARSKMNDFQKDNSQKNRENADILESPFALIDSLSHSELFACFQKAIENQGSFTEKIAERLDPVFQAKLIRLLRTPDTTEENLMKLHDCVARIRTDNHKLTLKSFSHDYYSAWGMIQSQIEMTLRIMNFEDIQKNNG